MGLYNILIKGFEDQYLQINYEYHTDLVFDYEVPAFITQYPDNGNEFLINGTAGQTSVIIKVDYTDNYMIDKGGFNITVNDRIAPYIVNEELQTVQFEVTYLDFSNSDTLVIIFEGQDISGNMNQIFITVVLENPPPIPVVVSTVETNIDKYDEQSCEQDYDAYILRMKLLIGLMAILIIIPIFIKLSGRITK
jgi:hypothetical protein